MFQTFDVAVNLLTVLIPLSGFIMIFVQSVNRLSLIRSFNLIVCLAKLLNHVAPSLGSMRSYFLAWRVLSDPVAGGSLRIIPGDYVSRENLVVLLLERGATEFSQFQAAASGAEKPALLSALQQNGIADPGGTLHKTREAAVQLELRQPDKPFNERLKIALLQCADSDFLAKINLRFDTYMAYSTDVFTLWTRIATLLLALLLSAAIDFNIVDVAHNFSVASLSSANIENVLSAKLEKTINKAATPPASGNTADILKLINQISGEYSQPFDNSVKLERILEPSSWSERNLQKNITKPGVILSGLLLSFGAPFWYEFLKVIMNFRGSLITRDEKGLKLITQRKPG